MILLQKVSYKNYKTKFTWHDKNKILSKPCMNHQIDSVILLGKKDAFIVLKIIIYSK